MISSILKFSTLALAVLATIASPVVADSSSPASATTFEKCTTKQGTKSVSPVPTTTYSLTVSVIATQIRTTTPVKTVTPIACRTTVTSTFVVVRTTSVRSTATFTSTSTVSITSAVTSGSTITSTDTSTSTITSQTDTYTVPTSSGFTALASAIGYVPKKRSSPFIPRGQAIQPVERAAACVTWTISSGIPTCSPAVYPAAVTCGELVEVVHTSTSVATVRSTSTTTIPASTSTITKTVTSTSTSTTGASTTKVTTTSTTVFPTVNPTSVVTATTTVTVISAASTTYAACSTDNIVNHANGNSAFSSITGINGANPDFSTIDGIDTGYDCCVACQTSGSNNCGGYIFTTDPDFCLIFNYNTCTPSTGLEQYETVAGRDPADGYTLGNGPCGQIINGGPEVRRK